MSTVFILGRQPALGLAELESLFGAAAVRPIGRQAAVVESDTITFSRLGGSLKAGRVLQTLETTNWQTIQNYLQSLVVDYTTSLPTGKLQLGLSVYDGVVSNKKIMAAGLSLKKALRANGRSVRLVPNSEPALGSAQVLYNKLTASLGCELLIIKDGSRTVIAQTTAVQDIDAYARRDRGRPKRDARVGMLPPKLAQVIINLAIDRNMKKVTSNKGVVLLDPFCGTGVILQEALLGGYNATGSDLEPRMVEYAKENIAWLRTVYNIGQLLSIDAQDATSATWTMSFDGVASEVYLGRPFTAPPAPDVLQKNRQDCNSIIKKSLQNIAAQTETGTQLCLAMPAWFVRSDIYHLPLLDSLEKLGYNRKKFVHVRDQDLIYHRDGQIVGRELVIITRK